MRNTNNDQHMVDTTTAYFQGSGSSPGEGEEGLKIDQPEEVINDAIDSYGSAGYRSYERCEHLISLLGSRGIHGEHAIQVLTMSWAFC
jgi:hypothetical protein